MWVVVGLWGGAAILLVLGCFFFAQEPLKVFHPFFLRLASEVRADLRRIFLRGAEL